jgi:AcrR family transcriptional regulator
MQEPSHTTGTADTRVHIIETATRLFASLGYDATPLSMIADSAGLDVPRVTDLAGSKRDIYLSVMEQVHLAMDAQQDAAFADFTRDRAGVHLLADRLLDFFVEHPEVPQLWIHRWLSDAADVPDLEALYLKPLINQATEALQDLVDPQVDLNVALWTVIWCVHGFVVGGVLTPSGQRTAPPGPVFRRRFRAHLSLLVDRMLGLSR